MNHFIDSGGFFAIAGILVLVLSLFLLRAIIIKNENRKQKEEEQVKTVDLLNNRIEVIYEAFCGNMLFYNFIALFQYYPVEIFSDQRVVNVVKQVLKSRLNNVNDFMLIDFSINKLPKKMQLMFDLFFIEVCKEVDKGLFKNLYKEAVNMKNKKAEESLKIILEKLN